MFRLLLALLLLAAAVPSTPVQAEEATCNPAQTIDQIGTLKSTGDAQQDLAALLAIAKEISAQHIACNGFTFTGEGAFVSDPFDIPAGSYRMSLEAAEGKSVLATVEHIGEDFCAGITNGSTPISRFDARKGCRATLNVSGSGAASGWTVTLEPLK